MQSHNHSFFSLNPVLPHRVKDHEKHRINAVYTNCSAGEKINLVTGVTYIWVYTADTQLIIGIEEPWKHRAAFNSMQDKDWNSISKQLQAGGQLGHPTLAAMYNPQSGKALPKDGRAYLGGELYINQKGTLILDNTSGRFGRVKNDVIDVLYFMHKIADVLEQTIKIRPDIRLRLPTAPYLDHYYAIWEKGTNTFDSAMKLLSEYTDEVSHNTIKSSLNDHNIHDMTSLLHYFKSQHSLPEELQRRLTFIYGQSNIPMPDKNDEIKIPAIHSSNVTSWSTLFKTGCLVAIGGAVIYGASYFTKS